MKSKSQIRVDFNSFCQFRKEVCHRITCTTTTYCIGIVKGTSISNIFLTFHFSTHRSSEFKPDRLVKFEAS